MEILQHSLKKADIDGLTTFQLIIWDILCLLFKNLLFNELSDDSNIEKGLGIDVFLKLKANDFVLYMSITEDCFYINSKYFDFYIYPEMEVNKIELLLSQLLQGKYFIKLGYGNKEKLVYKEVVFENIELQEFNDNKKIGFLGRKIKKEKKVDGFKLITG